MTSAGIDLGETGAGVMLRTAGEAALAFGYARLDCTEPATVRMLLARESDGAPVAMTSLESALAGNAFRFPVLNRLGRFGLVFANDNELDAACAVEVETAAGGSAGGSDIDVPARSATAGFLDELVPMQASADGGTVMVTCNRAVAALGLPFNSGDFATLAALTPEAGEDSLSHQILPLVLDGGGFQTHLLVTNLSDAANRCTMHFHGAGVNTARFPSIEGVTKDGFRRAMLELAADGGEISMLSFGRHTYAYGYAVLDCDEPVAARNLLSAASGNDVTGMAEIPPVRFAQEFGFPAAPGLSRQAIFLTNASEMDVSCEAALKIAGQQEPIAAESAIRVESESTALRFLADLFEVPDDFSGGAVTLACDRNIATLSISYIGAAFAAIPPVVLKFDVSPVFEEETVIEDLKYNEDSEIEPLQLPRASSGNGELVYSLSPEVSGLIFDSTTGQLSGTPTRPAAYDMSYTATDEDGDSVILEFVVTVEAKPDPDPEPEPAVSNPPSGGSNPSSPPPQQPPDNSEESELTGISYRARELSTSSRYKTFIVSMFPVPADAEVSRYEIDWSPSNALAQGNFFNSYIIAYCAPDHKIYGVEVSLFVNAVSSQGRVFSDTVKFRC